MLNRIPISLAALAAAGIVLSACAAPQGANAPNGASAERITVKTGSVESRIIGTGKVIAQTTSNIAFTRSGAVTHAPVKEGEQVKTGQVLAQPDPKDLELTACQQWARYLSAQASYSQTIKGSTAQELAATQASLNSANAITLHFRPGNDIPAKACKAGQPGISNLYRHPGECADLYPHLFDRHASARNTRSESPGPVIPAEAGIHE